MAKVNITSSVITSITGVVREKYEVGRSKIDHTLPEIPKGFAEWLYGLLFSKDMQEKLCEVLPEWYQPKKASAIHGRIATRGNSSWRNTPLLIYTAEEPFVYFDKRASRTDLPGIEAVSWDGTTISVVFAEDISPIPEKFKAYVSAMVAIPAAHDKITRASKEAAETMAEFLKQHTTLQSAVKEVPMLVQYFDPWIKMEYERKVEPKPRKPKEKVEKKQIDMSKLIAKAAADVLNI